MTDLKKLEIWFVTGSQQLYGPEALKQVAVNARQVVQALDTSAAIPATDLFKALVSTPEEAAYTPEETGRLRRLRRGRGRGGAG